MLTQYKYYMQEQTTHKKGIIVLAHYAEFCILGDNADTIYPIVKDVLTDKYGGQMYCYDTENYCYHMFTFGRHNADKVFRKMAECGYNPILSDYDKAFRESGGWEEVDRVLTEYNKREQEYIRLHQKPVQLMFDF